MDIMKLVCVSCNKRILSHSKKMTCALCHGNHHIQCIPLSRLEFDQICRKSNFWYCSLCNKDIFPCNFMDDDLDFLEALYDLYADNSLDFERINEMVFNPFTSNDDIKLSIFETDPDINFYSELNYINSRTSNYYSEDQFAERYSELICREKLSLLHWNIRSLPSHYLQLQAFCRKFEIQLYYFMYIRNLVQ